MAIMSKVGEFYKVSEEQMFCMVMEKDTFLPAKHKEYKFKDRYSSIISIYNC